MESLIKELLTIKNVYMTLYMDKQSSICITMNPVFHKRVKHIDVRFHYEREGYTAKEISLEYVASNEQQADIWTEPLPRQQFQRDCEGLGVRGDKHRTKE